MRVLRAGLRRAGTVHALSLPARQKRREPVGRSLVRPIEVKKILRLASGLGLIRKLNLSLSPRLTRREPVRSLSLNLNLNRREPVRRSQVGLT